MLHLSWSDVFGICLWKNYHMGRLKGRTAFVCLLGAFPTNRDRPSVRPFTTPWHPMGETDQVIQVITDQHSLTEGRTHRVGPTHRRCELEESNSVRSEESNGDFGAVRRVERLHLLADAPWSPGSHTFGHQDRSHR